MGGAPVVRCGEPYQRHSGCFVCGDQNGDGLGLFFCPQPDGSIAAQFTCDSKYQGCRDRLHGGVIAMTNCLLHLGVTAVTGRISVGFRRAARLSRAAEIKARIASCDGDLYRLKAEMRQAGVVVARADGKFLRESV
jgi:hypothetical protein